MYHNSWWSKIRLFMVATAFAAIVIGCVRQLDPTKDSPRPSSTQSAEASSSQDLDWIDIEPATAPDIVQTIMDRSIQMLNDSEVGLAAPEKLRQTATPMIHAVLAGRFDPIAEGLLGEHFIVNPDFSKVVMASYRNYTALKGKIPEEMEAEQPEVSMAFLWNHPEWRVMDILAISMKTLAVGHESTVDLVSDWQGARGTAKFTDLRRKHKGRFRNDEVDSLHENEVAHIELFVRQAQGHEHRLRFVFFYDRDLDLWAPAMLAAEVLPGSERPTLLF